jgi:hypothetical protein
MAVGFFQQAVDDGLRRIGHREHPPVGLRLQFHPALAIPLDGIGAEKPVKGFLYKMSAPRVSFYHFRDIETGMGNIAPAAPAYPYFIQYAVALLHDDHFQPGLHPGGIDRAKKTSGATAYYYQSLL